jgi:hypothetical protein
MATAFMLSVQHCDFGEKVARGSVGGGAFRRMVLTPGEGSGDPGKVDERRQCPYQIADDNASPRARLSNGR